MFTSNRIDDDTSVSWSMPDNQKHQCNGNGSGSSNIEGGEVVDDGNTCCFSDFAAMKIPFQVNIMALVSANQTDEHSYLFVK